MVWRGGAAGNIRKAEPAAPPKGGSAQQVAACPQPYGGTGEFAPAPDVLAAPTPGHLSREHLGPTPSSTTRPRGRRCWLPARNIDP